MNAAGNDLEIGINPRTTKSEMFDFRRMFGNSNRVILEVGSGKGRFLLRSAEQNHDTNYLGIERSLHYYRVIVERALKRQLSNVRVVNFDAFSVLQRMVPDGSLSEIHIYFPDPWPKARQQKRRIIRDEVMIEIERVLETDGVAFYVTDYRDYFDEAATRLSMRFEIEAGELTDGEPRTNYEEKYRREGRPIYQVTFRHRERDATENEE